MLRLDWFSCLYGTQACLLLNTFELSNDSGMPSLWLPHHLLVRCHGSYNCSVQPYGHFRIRSPFLVYVILIYFYLLVTQGLTDLIWVKKLSQNVRPLLIILVATYFQRIFSYGKFQSSSCWHILAIKMLGISF